MKSMIRVSAAALAAASLSLAAGLPATSVRGEYVEARTADIYTGPCFANSEVNLVGELAVFGWKIGKGSWEGVSLDGLGVVGVVKASATLGDVHSAVYPVKSVLIVDEKASPEQRIALQRFARQMGGDLLQDVVRVYYQPVELRFANDDLHSMQATLQAGHLAAIATRAIGNGDHVCSNEETWYPPLTNLDHAMPAFALAHSFQGEGLGTRWSSPDKRSAFVGSFQYSR